MEIAKTNGAMLLLFSPLQVANKIKFTSGIIDLNKKNITLASSAFLQNESGQSRIIGPLGGEIDITVLLNNPNKINPGNLGAIITSASALGITTVTRGYKTITGTGMASSINRYFNILPAQNSNLNATLRFSYFDEEINGQDENILEMFRSTDNGLSWIDQGQTNRDANQNFVEKASIQSFSMWTLSAFGALPVNGLSLYAKRLNNETALLNWTTLQEINNVGFYVQRRYENENNFMEIAFVPTKAVRGNSTQQLSYIFQDANSFTGVTEYRLRQKDIDGHFSFSAIKVVKGTSGQGEFKVQIWPIPSNGPVQVKITGLQRSEELSVIDSKGSVIWKQTIQNGQTVSIPHFAAGIYFIKLSNNPLATGKLIMQ
jgi:hypothetical protein